MAEIIIDGKAAAAKINAQTALECAELKKKYGIQPGLAVILVGEDPASQVYVSSKTKKCAELGIYSEKIVLPAECTEQQLLTIIDSLNRNPQIHGILVQSPTPAHICEEHVIAAINPDKDVDCFHPYNAGKMFLGDVTGFLPCTPWGVMRLLQEYNLSTAGKNAVVLGRSNIVGKPMMCLLSDKGADATVTLCHSRTKNMKELLLQADIIVAAVGRPEFVKADMVKPGAVVIDVGINRVLDSSSPKGYRLVGDVAYDEVAPVAHAITPVPGGVGPMTIAMLMCNTVRGFRHAVNR